METAKLVQSGDSQIVRLPDTFFIPGDEVRIHREGSRIVLEPLITSWDELLLALDEYSGEFLGPGRK